MSKKWIVIVACLVAAGGLWAVSRPPAVGPGKSAPPSAVVSVRPAEQRPMPLRLTAVGNVQSALVVNVRPRVEGEIVKVHFSEGQDVREGELLFSLDPRPFQATLRQAEANLARDRAQLDRAKTDQARYAELSQSGYASRQKLEQTVSDLGVLQATVKADQAAVDNARLNVDYAQIRAPIQGRTGLINGKLGNLAKPGDSQPLVTITQLQPISVSFSLAEAHLPRLRAAMAAGPVAARVSSTADPALAAEGHVSFLDSAIDPTTATIALKASFPNADQSLWPGQYVQVTLILGTEAEALTIPAEAVQTGQNGQFVYVLGPDGSAQMVPVGVDRAVDGWAVIRSGLKAGDKVVVEGQMRLSPGMKVTEKTADKPAEKTEKGSKSP